MPNHIHGIIIIVGADPRVRPDNNDEQMPRVRPDNNSEQMQNKDTGFRGEGEGERPFAPTGFAKTGFAKTGFETTGFTTTKFTTTKFITKTNGIIISNHAMV